MKKFLAASFTAVLLSGSISAFAATNVYTDFDSGFRLKAQPSWMEIGGKSFYGLADKPDTNETSLNIVCAFTAKEVEEATGKKFATAEFLNKFKDLLLLERNGLSPDKVKYMLFMPDPYEIKPGNKLALAPKELLDNSTISISTNKNPKQPYVYLHIVENDGKDTLKNLRRPVDMQIAITSANNMLYAIVSSFPLPNLKAQKERVEESTAFSEKRVRQRFADENKEQINRYIASRKAFQKGLSFFAPVKDTAPYGFHDELLGGRISLPEGWAYAQATDDTIDKNIPVKVTLAAPWNGVSEFMKHREGLGSALNKQDISELNFQKISEIALFASSKTKDKNSFAELFNNQLMTNLLIDKLIQEGLRHPSVNKYVDFTEINTTSDFSSNYGTVLFSGKGSVKNQDLFTVNAKAMFTPQSFGFAAYISKADNKTDPKTEKMFGNIKLIKK